jgi:hypothetical protein
MVVHPRADAGVVSMSVKEAKAVAARMSFFMINTPREARLHQGAADPSP